MIRRIRCIAVLFACGALIACGTSDDKQKAGAKAAGPAVLEEAFFTCRIDAGWSFEINDAGDILLAESAEGQR